MSTTFHDPKLFESIPDSVNVNSLCVAPTDDVDVPEGCSIAGMKTAIERAKEEDREASLEARAGLQQVFAALLQDRLAGLPATFDANGLPVLTADADESDCAAAIHRCTELASTVVAARNFAIGSLLSSMKGTAKDKKAWAKQHFKGAGESHIQRMHVYRGWRSLLGEYFPAITDWNFFRTTYTWEPQDKRTYADRWVTNSITRAQLEADAQALREKERSRGKRSKESLDVQRCRKSVRRIVRMAALHGVTKRTVQALVNECFANVSKKADRGSPIVH